MFQFDVNCFEQQKRKESKFGLKPIYWNVRVGKYQRCHMGLRSNKAAMTETEKNK